MKITDKIFLGSAIILIIMAMVFCTIVVLIDYNVDKMEEQIEQENGEKYNSSIKLIKSCYESFNFFMVIIAVGIAVGLVLHGFPFKFDFRRSTSYYDESNKK